MKKHILLFLTLIMSMMVTAQVTIQMEKEGGVYKVPCTVNGVKMKFIFDTGAATVSMSQTMAQFLLDGEYLSESDIKGTGKSVLADGSIVNHATINLRDVEIGGMHIHNVEATVIEGQNAPFLLGQSAIQELGMVSIEGSKLIIHSVDNELTDEQLEELDKQIERLMEANSWAAAIDCLLKLEMADGLSEYGLWELFICYAMNKQHEECIQSGKRWLSEYELTGDVGYKRSVYSNLGNSYYYGRNDYNTALLYYQKSLDILESGCLLKTNSFDYTEKMLLKLKAYEYLSIGGCYNYLGIYYNATNNYKKAIKIQCDYLNVTMENVQKGQVNDEDLGLMLAQYAFNCYDQQKDSEGNELMRISALCGCQSSIDYCRNNNLNYQVKSSSLFE